MDGSPLRFLTLLSPQLEAVYRRVGASVARSLGRSSVLETSGDISVLEGGFDVAFVCSPPYIWLADRATPLAEAVAAPVLEGDRYGGAPVYFSDVIVRRDAGFGSFDDLRGASFAVNEPWSWSGHGVVQHRLAAMGETFGFFNRMMATGFHQRSIRLVASGDVDAAAIDCQVLAIELGSHPGLGERIRVIEALGPSPIQPVIASTALPPSLRDELGAAFASLDTDDEASEAMTFGLIRRWVRVGDDAYDSIRRMQRAVALGQTPSGGGNVAETGTHTP